MKATHRIKLKSIEDILKQEETHKLLAVDYLIFINDNQGNYIDVKRRDDDCFLTEDTCIGHGHVSRVEEIKPEIEIPSGDFWVITKSMRYTAKLSRDGKGGFDILESPIGWIQDSFSEREVLIKLKEGTWTICDEPEKVMIPWSDEDWKEWFLNDGILYAKQYKVYIRAITLIHDAEEDENFMIVDAQDDFFRKKDVCDGYTDRHGKPFMKEA